MSGAVARNELRGTFVADRRSAGAALLALLMAAPTSHAADCGGAPATQRATLRGIRAWLARRGDPQVLTFVGYSGAGYEDPQAMLGHAARVLIANDPANTVINIGGTVQGIGAVYALARSRGFTTIGIVSSLAQGEGVLLAPCADRVFFIADKTWGGADPASGKLSPTSAATVAVSSRMVGIGGGEIGRDELLAAQRAGKPVVFHPADLRHQAAIDKARQRGEPPPTDFRGAAHLAMVR